MLTLAQTEADFPAPADTVTGSDLAAALSLGVLLILGSYLFCGLFKDRP